MANRMNGKCLLGAVLLMGWGYFFMIMAVPAQAEEKILSFHSDIKIHPDASLTVTETITVRAENDQIKRGIYRDFPTRYREKFGLIRRVGFNVRRVLRDGEPESFHFEGLPNGKRVYFGQEDVILPPGEYTYTLIYKTDRQLGFFPEFDELYWNVTGNDWNFPIEKASAVVHLPEGVGGKIISIAGYTGLQGAKGQDFGKEVEPSAGTVHFFSTRSLALKEGLTIAVSWPKGVCDGTSESKRIFVPAVRQPGFSFRFGRNPGDPDLLSYRLVSGGERPGKGYHCHPVYPPGRYEPGGHALCLEPGI